MPLTVSLAVAGMQPARADVLTVTATGTISGSCSLNSTVPFSSPLFFETSGSSQAQATVNCNQGFRVNALSAKGAIKSSATAPTGFTNTLPYNLTVSIPLETGGPVSTTCASGTLASGQSSCLLSPLNTTGLSSGGKASINKTATLTIAWTSPTSPRLIASSAGGYSDTITLTITAVP